MWPWTSLQSPSLTSPPYYPPQKCPCMARSSRLTTVALPRSCPWWSISSVSPLSSRTTFSSWKQPIFLSQENLWNCSTDFLKSREPPQGHSVGLEWCHFRWLSSGSRLLRWRPLFPIKRWDSQEQAMGPPLTCFSPCLAPCLHSATHGCRGGCGLESSGTVWLTAVRLDCLVERVVGLPLKRPKF